MRRVNDLCAATPSLRSLLSFLARWSFTRLQLLSENRGFLVPSGLLKYRDYNNREEKDDREYGIVGKEIPERVGILYELRNPETIYCEL